MKLPTTHAEFVTLLDGYFGPGDDPKEYTDTARYIAGLEFDGSKCEGCPQNCCTMSGPEAKSAWVTFAEDDLAAIYARYPDAPRIPKKNIRRGKDGRNYYREDKTQCVFLGEGNRCTVYEARPLWCRDWPRTDVYLSGFEDLAFSLSACPGATYPDPTVVLNSGGLASLVTLGWLAKEKRRSYSVFVDYGQPAAQREEAAARAIARHYGGEFFKETLRLELWKHFPFFFPDAASPRYEFNPWVPMRNFILFGIAASYCDGLGIPAMALPWDGRLDRKGEPIPSALDQHARYVEALRRAFDQSSDLRWTDLRRLKMLTPLQNRTRRQIVQMAKRLGAPLQLAWSCDAGGERPCGTCRKCRAQTRATARN